MPFLGCPRQRGVCPQLSLESASTSSRSTNSRTTASCPYSAAHNSGVCPQLSLESASTSSRSTSSRTTASCPPSAARDNGVCPYLSLESASTSSRSNNNRTTASCPPSLPAIMVSVHIYPWSRPPHPLAPIIIAPRPHAHPQLHTTTASFEVHPESRPLYLSAQL
ncbi:hypothetical protein K440DRAFT_404183 [Wilcoxina mikolae CBS 423.85]|nr:hypothetical protein K440DRAFT_404183 [Wilcoxina mikolae CBS 423.85]